MINKSYFDTYVHNRENNQKERMTVLGDTFKIKINEFTLYCGIYRPTKKRQYYIVELKTGLSFGQLYQGSKEKCIDNMLTMLTELKTHDREEVIKLIDIMAEDFNKSNIKLLKNKSYDREVTI